MPVLEMAIAVTASVLALLVSVVMTVLLEHVLLFVLAMVSGPILPAVSDTENKQAVLVVNVTKDGRAIGAKLKQLNVNLLV